MILPDRIKFMKKGETQGVRDTISKHTERRESRDKSYNVPVTVNVTISVTVSHQLPVSPEGASKRSGEAFKPRHDGVVHMHCYTHE